MELTAAGKAHVERKKKAAGSNVSLLPVDIVNKELADKRRRDKACKYKVICRIKMLFKPFKYNLFNIS